MLSPVNLYDIKDEDRTLKQLFLSVNNGGIRLKEWGGDKIIKMSPFGEVAA